MRQRSISQSSDKEEKIQNKEAKQTQFPKKAIPLRQENNMLKDRLIQMRFEVEDNLQVVIDELDKDLQLKAKLIDFQQLFSLIKEQINKDHEKIENQQEQIQRLQFNITQIVNQREEDYQNFEAKNKELIDQNYKEKLGFTTEKSQLDQQIKTLNCQNCDQVRETEQIKMNLQRELQNNEQLKKQLLKYNELELNLKNQKANYDTMVQQLQHQIQTDNEVFKNELVVQQQRIEQKYKQMIQENKQLTQQISEMKQNYHQVKQQKDSIEKTLDHNNQKMKDIKTVVITDKQTMSKNEKVIDELQKEVIFLKNKVQIAEKREQKLNQQIEQNEEQILDLQQQNSYLKKQQSCIDQIHQQNIKKIEAQHQESIKNLHSQLQIQKIKYEKLLGKQTQILESEEYQLIDFSCQYEDPIHILYVQQIEKTIENQLKIIENLKLQAKQREQEHKEEITKIFENHEKEKRILTQQQQQDLQRQQAHFDEQILKIQSDCNYKLQLYSQQYSFQLDQQKQVQKQLTQIIDQSKLSQDEKTKLLEMTSEEIIKWRAKYDQDLNEEKSKQRQLAFDFENQIFNIKQEHTKIVEALKREIESLQNKIVDLSNKEQAQRSKIAQILSEQQQDKGTISQMEFQISRKINELSKQNETIKQLNQKLNVLKLEVENARKTYNIFAPPTAHSSRGYLRKTETDIAIDPMPTEQKRLSTSDAKFKSDFHFHVELPKKSPRPYQIRQLHQF